MKVQESPKDKHGFHSEKQSYEPPIATCVQVKFEERVLGCLFTTIKNCGLTE